jgi:hypothetical protein
MPSFTFEEVIDFIKYVRGEAYYISVDYYNTLGEEQAELNDTAQWYLYPVIPYMQSMSSEQIAENKALFYFIFNVFMSQNKPPYQLINDNGHMYSVAKEQYDKL